MKNVEMDTRRLMINTTTAAFTHAQRIALKLPYPSNVSTIGTRKNIGIATLSPKMEKMSAGVYGTCKNK